MSYRMVPRNLRPDLLAPYATLGYLLRRSLLRPAGHAAYHDGDHTEDHGGDPQNLSGPVPALQAEVVANAAEDDAGELYGDAVDHEEANHRAQNAEHAHQDTDSRLQSLLAPFRGKAVDPLVGLGAVMSLSGLPRRFSR